MVLLLYIRVCVNQLVHYFMSVHIEVIDVCVCVCVCVCVHVCVCMPLLFLYFEGGTE